MKKVVSVACLVLFLALSGQAFAYSLSLSSLSLGLGESGRVDLNLSLSPGEQLFGFNLGLGFDNSRVRFDNLVFGDRLSDYVTGVTAPSAANPGLVTFDGALFGDKGEKESLQLASLFFTGIAGGTSPLNVSGALLDMAGTSEILAGAAGSIEVGGGENPVPEPATLLLTASGLAGLAAVRRRKTEG